MMTPAFVTGLKSSTYWILVLVLLASFLVGIPSNSRMEAMQAAILLMPDPNREALQTLLLFLNEVAANSERNQVNICIKRKRQFTQSPTTELCTIAL